MSDLIFCILNPSRAGGLTGERIHGLVLLSTTRLHYCEREAILDRHVTGTEETGIFFPKDLGKGSFSSKEVFVASKEGLATVEMKRFI